MGEMKTITKIPVGAIALMAAVIGAVLGLIEGIISAIGIAAFTSALPSSISNVGLGAAGALVVIIGSIISGFIGGYIVTAILALIYNWVAPRIGGVKLELE